MVYPLHFIQVVPTDHTDLLSLVDQLPMEWNQLLTMILNIIGTVALGKR